MRRWDAAKTEIRIQKKDEGYNVTLNIIGSDDSIRGSSELIRMILIEWSYQIGQISEELISQDITG